MSQDKLWTIHIFDLPNKFTVLVITPDEDQIELPWEGGHVNYNDKKYMIEGPAQGYKEYKIFEYIEIPHTLLETTAKTTTRTIK